VEIARVEKNNYCERSRAEPRVLIEPKKNLFRPKKLAALSLSSGVPSLCSLKLSCQKGRMIKNLNRSRTFSSQSNKRCYYCDKRGHVQDTCWDLHGWSSGGRGRNDRGGGRSGRLRHTQQAYANHLEKI
jgi:hypothetical protein